MKIPFKEMDEAYQRFQRDLDGNSVLSKEASENIEAYVWGKPGTMVGRIRVVIDKVSGTVVMTGDYGRVGLYFNSGFEWSEFFPGKHAIHIPWDRAIEKASFFRGGSVNFDHYYYEIVALAVAMHEIGSELGK